jgi:hypothetical protein
MISLNSLLLKRETFRNRKAIEDALALSSQKRSTPRWPDFDSRVSLSRDRMAHGTFTRGTAFPNRGSESLCSRSKQTIADTDAALSHLFNEMPETDAIQFRVTHPDSAQCILAGTVERSGRVPRTRGASARTRLWHRGITAAIVAIVAVALGSDHQVCRLADDYGKP